MICPKCKSRRYKVTSSPVEKNGTKNRYHKCEDCNFTGKTVILYYTVKESKKDLTAENGA
jgi:transcriptional regulator NrdR family protein